MISGGVIAREDVDVDEVEVEETFPDMEPVLLRRARASWTHFESGSLLIAWHGELCTHCMLSDIEIFVLDFCAVLGNMENGANG